MLCIAITKRTINNDNKTKLKKVLEKKFGLKITKPILKTKVIEKMMFASQGERMGTVIYNSKLTKKAKFKSTMIFSRTNSK